METKMIEIKTNSGRSYEVYPPDKDMEICIVVSCTYGDTTHEVYLTRENLTELLKLFEDQ
jgi:hypothetical protein